MAKDNRRHNPFFHHRPTRLDDARDDHKRHGRKHHRSRRRKPPKDRPWQSQGIEISLGPHEGHVLKHWVTFPVTPESIPITTGATINTTRVINKGEFPGFAGRNLDSISFSGRLEPPLFYANARGLPPQQNEGIYGDVGISKYRWNKKLLSQARTTSDAVKLTHKRYAVMEDGAHAGPAVFVEPEAFKELLLDMEYSGEVCRLIIGDNYGYNDLAVIESFVPRYEDPDPDVILFDLSLREWREHDTLKALDARRKPKREHYMTKKGDTLHKIAKKMWGVHWKWRQIAKLNRKRIAGLWWYPDEPGGSRRDWRDQGTIGHRQRGRTDGFRIHKGQIKPMKDMISPDLKFRPGIRLRIEPRKRHKDGRGKDGDKRRRGDRRHRND
jgi:hypothetical protein